MAATLREVANRAGVSVSTVSRVIRETEYIAIPTKQKVLEAIKDLQYRPSTIARHLRSGRTYLIGFVLEDIANPFFSHAVKGAEQYLHNYDDHSFELVLINTNSEPDREIKALELMLDKHAEAIILSSTATPECIEMIREVVENSHIPIVSIDNQLGGSETGLVTADNQEGAYQVTAHLLQHGHKRIGFIAGPKNESHVVERLAGCGQALSEHHLKLENQLVSHGNWTVEDGYRITMNWLATKESPTAIFGLNNFFCMGALTAITECGLRVPDQIALASFDDIEFGHLLRPCLTALDYSYQKIGEEAMRLALKSIQANENGTANETVRLPVKLMIRESCGCRK